MGEKEAEDGMIEELRECVTVPFGDDLSLGISLFGNVSVSLTHAPHFHFILSMYNTDLGFV